MRLLTCCAAAVLLAAAATSARADGLVYQLPADGSWAQYDLEATMSGGGEARTADGLVRVASVGRVTENDQPCRWIEVRFEIKDAKRPLEVMVLKVLVPEKNLAKGQDPLAHAVRAWIKKGQDRPPQELKDPGNIDQGPLPLVLAAPMKDQKDLEPVPFDSKKTGKLRSKGVEGKVAFPMKGPGGNLQGTVESRLYDKAPFGTVSSHWALELKGPDATKSLKASFDLKLADFGTGAKSEMPNEK